MRGDPPADIALVKAEAALVYGLAAQLLSASTGLTVLAQDVARALEVDLALTVAARLLADEKRLPITKQHVLDAIRIRARGDLLVGALFEARPN